MKLTTLATALLTLALAPACMVDSEDREIANTETQNTDDDHGGECAPSPVMISGDFDGNGRVGFEDVRMIEEYRRAGDYAAFFDMNADGELTRADVRLLARNMFRPSHPRDREIAQAWADTERFRDMSVALGASFAPFTQDLQGHGMHFANFDRVFRWQAQGAGFEPGLPEGLNYAADGHLAAVFYYSPGAFDVASVDPSLEPRTVVMEIPPTEGFTGDHDHWHHHVGACFNGLGTAAPDFDQCVVGTECEATLWSAKFHMLHLWMYDYNPCGAFAGTNPNLSPDAPPEPHHMECMIGEVVDTVLPYGSL